MRVLHKQREILCILLISLILKALFQLYLNLHQNYWESGYSFYYEMAVHFLQDGFIYVGDKTAPWYAFRPPLYPLFIAIICKITHHAASWFIFFQALISTLTVYLTYLITCHLTHNKKAALCAALLCAFYPYSFVHDTRLQENVLYNCIALAAIYSFIVAFSKKNKLLFFLTGLLLGAAMLTRTSHLIHSLFLCMLLFFVWRSTPKKALLYASLILLGLTLCVSPWMARNKLLSGSFSLTSEYGFALARAHNAYTFLYYPYRASIDESWGEWLTHLPTSQDKELKRLLNNNTNEFVLGRWFQDRALEYIHQHKLATLWHGLYKAAVNFMGILSPQQDALKNWIYFFSYWLLTMLAFYALLQCYQTFYAKIFMTLCLSQATSSFVFWAHTSHRTFLDPMLAILAGIGLHRACCVIFPILSALLQRSWGRGLGRGLGRGGLKLH